MGTSMIFDTSESRPIQVFEAEEDPQAILHAWQRIWQAEETGDLHELHYWLWKYDPDQTVAVFVATQQH